MEWRTSESDARYTLTIQGHHCNVRHTRHGGWSAIVVGQGSAIVQYGFISAEEGRHWCEAQIEPVPLERAVGA